MQFQSTPPALAHRTAANDNALGLSTAITSAYFAQAVLRNLRGAHVRNPVYSFRSIWRIFCQKSELVYVLLYIKGTGFVTERGVYETVEETITALGLAKYTTSLYDTPDETLQQLVWDIDARIATHVVNSAKKTATSLLALL